MKAQIKEHDDTVGGSYQCRGVALDIPASTGEHTFDYSWPHNIALLSAEIAVGSEHIGDDIKVHVGPDTIVGALAANCDAASTSLTTSGTALQYVDTGKHLKLFDGTNQDDLGRALSVDLDTGVITFETATTNSFAAATPTYIQMTTKIILEYEFGLASRYTLGESKIGSSNLPANTILRFIYNNTDGVAKKFVAHLEYLY